YGCSTHRIVCQHNIILARVDADMVFFICRIETAKNLLLSGNLSVSEVGDAVGFSSVYSFSRAFKKHAGLSPTDFTQNAIYPIL
ncbi:MAG: helix-turn-helix transcriptional regulator, partial [Clostridia bacterium]|nr:helix-turn-helix transcriptional regulator [Clostridia bacterium]